MFGPKENSEEHSTWLLRGSQRDRVAVDHSGNRLSNKLSCWLFFLLYVACPSHQLLFPGIISQINTLSQSQILQVRVLTKAQGRSDLESCAITRHVTIGKWFSLSNRVSAPQTRNPRPTSLGRWQTITWALHTNSGLYERSPPQTPLLLLSFEH